MSIIEITTSIDTTVQQLASASGTSSTYSASYGHAAYTFKENEILNNSHTATTTIRIRYFPNGGSGSPGNHEWISGVPMKISSIMPTRDNYQFKGWSRDDNDTKAQYQSGETVTLYEGIWLYAVWAPTYTVSYNPNAPYVSEMPENQVKFHNAPLQLSAANPQRSRYRFMGWGRSYGATNELLHPRYWYAENKHLGLYAIWFGDAEIPAIPDRPTASKVTLTEATLNWKPVLGAGDYKLYRDSKLIFSGLNNSYSYIDKGLSPRNTYSYTLMASNNNGTSKASEPLNITSEFLWPVTGYTTISSEYNPERMHPILEIIRPHNGIDISAPKDTPILAAADGIVTTADDSDPSTGYGYVVKISHDGGYSTVYAHCSKLAPDVKKKDAEVKKGNVIAYVGSTGLSEANHLHWEVRKNGTPINPATLTNNELYNLCKK